MIDNCYTFKELCQKYNWNTTMASIDGQIKFALARGVEIEVAFKKGSTYFRIIREIELYTFEELCNKYNRMLNKGNNESIISHKMMSDKLLEKYKKELVKATNYLKNYPDGIITSSVLIVKNKDEVFMLMDGYDNKYKYLNSKHLLIWKLMERYNNLGFKTFNLGGMTNPEIDDNKYKGLNDFKIGFDSKAIEYIGDLELITNNALYFMYKNSFQIKNVLKK